MTAHALLMISAQQTWHVLGFIKGFVVTALTFGGLDRCRTVVMAPLAKGHLTAVEIFGQFVFADVVQQRLNDFTMREFHWFILLGKVFNRQFLRHVGDHGIRKRGLDRRSQIQQRLGQNWFLIRG